MNQVLFEGRFSGEGFDLGQVEDGIYSGFGSCLGSGLSQDPHWVESKMVQNYFQVGILTRGQVQYGTELGFCLCLGLVC